MKRSLKLTAAISIAMLSFEGTAACKDVQPSSPDPLKETAMAVGTMVAVISSSVATAGSSAQPGISFIAGDLGCEYAGQLINAVRDEPHSLVVGQSWYVISQMELPSNAWQAFVHYAGPAGALPASNVRQQSDAGLSDVSSAAVMPASSTIGAIARLVGKNGLNGEHVAMYLAIANFPHVLREALASKQLIAAGEALDEVGRDVADAADRAQHQAEANLNGTLRTGQTIIIDAPKALVEKLF
jgi:hypothetical protein